MKRFKKIYILIGVLAAVCLATIGVMQIEDHKEKIKNTEKIILAVPPASVRSLSWEYESETLGFHKTEEDNTDEKWVYDTDEAFPVDEEQINVLLEQFEELGASFIIEDVEDYGQYGLEDPVCTIHLTSEEQSYDINLGNYSSMDSRRYVSIGDSNVYLVKNDPLDYFDVTISDMIKHDNIPLLDKITSIKFAGSENYNIACEEDSNKSYCAEDIYFVNDDDNTLPLDTANVEDYLQHISNLNLKNYVTYNVTEDELADFGLDEPELTITVDYITEDENDEEVSDTFVMSISRSAEDKAENKDVIVNDTDAEENEEEENNKEDEEVNAYVRVGGSQIVYQITSSSFENIMNASCDSLRHQNVFFADTSDISRIDITLEDEVYTITSKKKDDKLTYYFKDEEIELASFKNCLSNLNVTEFTKAQSEQKEEIQLVIYLDNEYFPEVEIELYRQDGNNCLAVVNKEPIAFVRRSNVMDLVEAAYEIILE